MGEKSWKQQQHDLNLHCGDSVCGWCEPNADPRARAWSDLRRAKGFEDERAAVMALSEMTFGD